MFVLYVCMYTSVLDVFKQSLAYEMLDIGKSQIVLMCKKNMNEQQHEIWAKYLAVLL